MTRKRPAEISRRQARAIWLNAQGLTANEPFGAGPEAVTRAVKQLGYVQIDTINVIERCHHHILFTRIPEYKRADLGVAQSSQKSVFEYWTHALSYVPTADFRFFVPAMRRWRRAPAPWYVKVSPAELKRMLARIERDGPLSLRDIKSGKLVEKTHLWASRKPERAVLQRGFYNGQLAISARQGMLKTYDLTDRHFGWPKAPRPATDPQISAYLLDRALTAQGIVSIASICHLNPPRKPAIAALIDRRVRAKTLHRVTIAECPDIPHWATPETLEVTPPTATFTRILSPFDPLIIQRRRTSALLAYDHVFEAYVPANKRKLGYFTLPVLHGDEIIAALDLKTDRQAKRLIIQAWYWIGTGNQRDHKALVEAELDRFERFQLAT
ncbi:MAG: winged helix-turn-helix domain-containing protein [Alphaproteobacteria bacterium]|nr:winged helix-turn-helix domain-containing protein [Alphaproteobacteria bacterium]